MNAGIVFASRLAASITLELFVASQASFAQTQDVFSGDNRLSPKHTVKIAARALSASLPEIGKQWGVNLALDPTAPDERVLLISHERTLTDTLRAIASFTGMEWKKVENVGTASYVLIQTPQAKALAETAYQSELKHACDRILSDAAAIRKYSEMSEIQLRQRLAGQGQEIANESNKERRQSLERNKALGAARQNPIVTVVAKLIDSVGERPISDALQGKITEYVLPAQRGKNSIPLEVDTTVSDLLKNNRQIGLVREFDNYSLLIGPAENSREISFRLTIFNNNPEFANCSTSSATFPSDILSDVPPASRTDFRVWKDIAALNREVFISTSIPTPVNRPEKPGATISSFADSLIQIDSAAPTDIIADAFPTDASVSTHNTESLPVGEALNRLSEAYGRRWTFTDGFVNLKSMRHDSEQRWNPPPVLFDSFLAKVQQGNVGVEDILSLSALPLYQLEILERIAWNVRPLILGPSIAYKLINEVRSLSTAQRKLTEEGGLLLNSLPERQRASLLFAFQDYGAATVHSKGERNILTIDFTPDARLLVRRTEEKMWAWRKKGIGPLESYQTKELAMAALQVHKSTVPPGDLRLCIVSAISISLESGQESWSRRIDLPLRWVADTN